MQRTVATQILHSSGFSSSSFTSILRTGRTAGRLKLRQQTCSSRASTSRRAHTHAHSPAPKETPLLGDDPPLYDGKPRWWARWAWGLLAVDMLFTASTIDITMKHWSQPVEPKTEQSSSKAQTRPAQQSDAKYELRPLYQRLLMSAGQLLAGAVVGGMIMASRDRTVWKMQLKRLPIVVASKSKTATSRGNIPPHTIKHTHIPPRPVQATLSLSTASGRSKRFHVHDCLLSAGRDPTEVILRVAGLRGHWWIGLNGSKVLGLDEAETAKSMYESGIKRAVNSGEDDGRGTAALVEMRDRMIRAWSVAGGMVDLGRRPETANESLGRWTSGPVTR